MSNAYFIENIVLPDLTSHHDIVITGDSAFYYNGFSVTPCPPPTVFTSKEYLDNIQIFSIVDYQYTPIIDKEHYIAPMRRFPKVYLPIMERAIVECIKFDLSFIDEGTFCDALERYQFSSEYNPKLLEEVSNFFNVDYSKVDYWIKEARDYNFH